MENTLMQLWKLFHYSPKKLACFLKTSQEFRKLNLDQLWSTLTKILQKACKTRWLSIDASVQAVSEEYIPIVQTLNKLEADATACGQLKKMNSVVFID